MRQKRIPFRKREKRGRGKKFMHDGKELCRVRQKERKDVGDEFLPRSCGA